MSTQAAEFRTNEANTNLIVKNRLIKKVNLAYMTRFLTMHSSSRGFYHATRLALHKSNWKWTKIASARPCLACRYISNTAPRPVQPADDPSFVSIVDNPPNLIRTGKRHGLGLIILGMKLPTRKYLMLTHDKH